MYRVAVALTFALVGLGLVADPAYSQDRPGRSLEDQVAEEHEWMLQSEGMRSRIIGVDSRGVPKLCGTREEDLRPSTTRSQRSVQEEKEFLGWELVPGVVPADGSESFYVKAEVNLKDFEKIFLDLGNRETSAIVAPENESRDEVLLRDDGEGNDEVEGDDVYTSKSLQVDADGVPLLPAYGGFASPDDGFRTESLLREEFDLVVERPDGSTEEILIEPRLLIMEQGIHDPGAISAADSIQASDHIVNLKGGFGIQKEMRGLDFVQDKYARRAYGRVRDEYEFITFISSNHVELFPRPERISRNFIAGRHTTAQVDYEGTSRPMFDNSEALGSSGTLLGLNRLDVFGRGLVANTTTHEILHQWSAYIPDSLGLTDQAEGVHYDGGSNVKSLLGGFKWSKSEDGTFTVDCDIGRNGAFTASPLDLYMMGLAESSEVDTLWALSNENAGFCGAPVEPNEVQDTVSIENIQDAVGGPREPGPESARKDYSILFIVESNGRLLTDLEMAFYDLVAQHYTSSTAEGGYMARTTWTPIQPYFAHGTTWSSEVVTKSPIPVELASFEGVTTDNGIRLTWQTASETGNAGFKIQRKAGAEKGVKWTEIGFVESKAPGGTTSDPQAYRFTDADLPYDADRLTYRLKQIDNDGTTTLSDPVVVERSVSEVELLPAFPNPAQSQATVRFALPERQEVEIRLYDALGRQVRTVVNSQKEGRHEETIDVSGLSSGTYFLRLQAGNAERSQQVTVVR